MVLFCPLLAMFGITPFWWIFLRIFLQIFWWFFWGIFRIIFWQMFWQIFLTNYLTNVLKDFLTYNQKPFRALGSEYLRSWLSSKLIIRFYFINPCAKIRTYLMLKYKQNPMQRPWKHARKSNSLIWTQWTAMMFMIL